MGLPWIKVYGNLPDHPKSDALAAALKRPRAWTHVVELWLWVSRVQPDGDLSALPDAAVAKRAGWNGDAGAFVAALLSVGFLDPDRRLHGWEDEQGAHARRREADRKRQAKHRADRDACVTGERVTRDNRDASVTVTRLEEIERRGEEDQVLDPSRAVARGESPASDPAPAPASEVQPPLLTSPPKDKPRRKRAAKPAPPDNPERVEAFRAWRAAAVSALGLPDDTPPGKESAVYAKRHDGWPGRDRLLAALEKWRTATRRPESLLAALNPEWLQGALRDAPASAASQINAAWGVAPPAGEPF